MQNVGSRASVMYGLAKKTSGGLTKDDLMYNKKGKIVSKKKSMMARKNMRGGSGSLNTRLVKEALNVSKEYNKLPKQLDTYQLHIFNIIMKYKEQLNKLSKINTIQRHIINDKIKELEKEFNDQNTLKTLYKAQNNIRKSVQNLKNLNNEQYERYLYDVQIGTYKDYTLKPNFKAFRLNVNNKNMFTDRYNISISGKSRILEQKFNRSKDIYNGHYIWYTENSYYYFYLDYIDEEDKWYWILRHDKEKYIPNNITPIPLGSNDIVAYKQIEDLRYPLPYYRNTEWNFNQISGKPITSKLSITNIHLSKGNYVTVSGNSDKRLWEYQNNYYITRHSTLNINKNNRSRLTWKKNKRNLNKLNENTVLKFNGKTYEYIRKGNKSKRGIPTIVVKEIDNKKNNPEEIEIEYTSFEVEK